MKLVLTYFAILCFFELAFAAPVDVLLADEREDHEQTGGFFQGDMEIDLTRNGVLKETKRWPNNVLHFRIDEVFDIPRTNYILRAMNMIEEVSCIRFHPATSDITNYIHFIGEPSGCHTKVGYQNKLQTLNLQLDALDRGCFKLGTIIHELMHSLGFHHQQSASDRDNFVRIVEENIKDGKEGNFKKYDDATVTDFGIQYDYGSILHYSATAFSRNGDKTIVPIANENIEIGQRRAMSAGDIDKLNIMYKCPLIN